MTARFRSDARSALLSLVLAGAPAIGQSLFLREFAPPVDVTGAGDPAAGVRELSLLAIDVPRPRSYAVHDLVTIIVDETSRSSLDQKLNTKKETESTADLNALVDPEQLLELRLLADEKADLSLLDLASSREFKGRGAYDRSDRFQARITATVIDVKPNGTIVLEARKQIVRDSETSTIVLSGICRREDITTSNTVLSSQLADLALSQKNEGKVPDAASRGFFTELFDTVFSF